MSEEIQKTVLTEENQHVQQHPLAELQKEESKDITYQKLWVEAYGDCV
jgi:hypothetical protein